jgi:hypothetical protein
LKQYSFRRLIGAGSSLVASDFDVGLCNKEFSVAFLWPAIRGKASPADWRSQLADI